MRLMTSAMAAIALIVVATSVLWPRAPSIELSTAAMPSLEEFHKIAGVNKLPVQDIDDQSLNLSDRDEAVIKFIFPRGS